PSRARRIVEKGDILMSTVRPNLQGFSLIKNDVKDLIASTGFAVITATKCSNEYLFQYLFSSGIERQFYQLLVGSNYPAINSSDVRKLKIPLPHLPEQRAIAHVLSLMDTAINKNNKLIAQKELQKKWLMQNLLTGMKRLKGFESEKWNKIGAGELFKSHTKKGFENELLLSATQDRGIIPRTMLEGRVTMPTTGTKGFKLVDIGDYVISLRSFQGGLEYSYYRGLVSPAYTVLKPKKKINEEFYMQYFKSYDFIGHLSIAVIGIRDGKQISYDDFCTVVIPYPTIEEQTAIAKVLQAADKEIALLKAKTEKLREQKKGMMQVLLTGKKRLKID
ncbi:MAG: restriction endonuclease subunit S, partial [Candidatus Electryoneaceae bacterium]|nr:restriction endonuclease subunit S [Candidatus Electryoneaceae bacterium]